MTYPSIRIEGAILSPDILDRLEDLPGQRPGDFGFDASAKVKDEIARAWADAQDYWRIFQRKIETLKPDSPATTETRQQWVVPLLGLLGTLTPEDYYKDLLRLIYRLLFLMVIEERDLVFPPKATASQRDVYRRFYSVQRL